MSNTIKSLLPPLHDGHRVPAVESRGAWQVLGDGDLLEVIARGLNTGEKLQGTIDDIVSVPDIWAQLTVFHNALTVERHPLHTRATAEWRGLLATFALAAYQSQPVTCELVSLSTLSNGRWAEIVRRLPPSTDLLDGRCIDEIGLVRAGVRLIAFAQPLTLLAPSRSLPDFQSEPPSVPWMLNGHFLDPLRSKSLSPQERAVLAHFLEFLCNDLGAEQAHGGDVPVLLGLARSYLDDAQKLGIAQVTQFEPEPVRLDLPRMPVFETLRRRFRGGMAGKAVSDCLVRMRSGLTTPLKGVVLVDLELDRQLGLPASEIRIWDRYSLRRLQENPELIAPLRSEAQAAGFLVIGSEQLFLANLYRADGIEGEQGFEQHPAGAREYLLPLSPFVLALMDRGTLSRACRVASAGPGGTTVDLNIRLDSGRSVTLGHHYMTEESSEPPFTLSVWPDFQAPWWQLHLGYSSATPDLQFVTTGLLSLEGLNQSLSAQDGFSAVAAARALLMGDPTRLSTNTWFRDDGQNASALFELPGSAEAAVLEDRRAATKRIAGLLLLPEPVMAPGGFGGGRATVGIDFGTTNTAIYMQLGSQEPIPMLIQPRHILAYRLAEQSRDQLDAELLPVNPVEVPFQTILRDRLKTLGGQRRPFRDTLIYFAQRRMAAIKTAVGETHDLFANLKWANDQPARERIQLFLTQAVMLALVEAGARGVEPGELSFRFSFPEAFRPAQLESFKAAARNAVRLGQLFVSNPAEQGTPSVTPEPTFETESVATAQYFIHRLSTPSTEGLVTFDIGGHTTDVAVVQSQSLSAEHLAWRGSFQLAGQHLLINHLRQNRGILDQLAAQQPQLADLLSITPERGTASPEAQTLAIELLVNSPAFADAIEHVLPTLGGTPNAEWLRSVALSGLAGLFDYVGRTVRHLIETGQIEQRAGTSVSLGLGGRASLLYRALLRSNDEQQLVLKFFTMAAGETMPQARLVFSKAPKQEVAYGLVRDDSSLMRASGSEPMLGEAVSVGRTQADATSLISELDLSKVWRIEKPVEFSRFVQRLPELRVKQVMSEREMGELVGAANSDIAKALSTAMREPTPGGAPPDTSLIEPPFIVLLRKFVHRLATDPKSVKT